MVPGASCLSCCGFADAGEVVSSGGTLGVEAITGAAVGSGDLAGGDCCTEGIDGLRLGAGIGMAVDLTVCLRVDGRGGDCDCVCVGGSCCDGGCG